ncbi:MAG: SusE domain-containing protein [Ferruginibacter sp.]
MKKTIKKILIFSLLVAVFASCKKDENRIQFLGGTDPVLTPSITDSIPLSFLTKEEEAVKFTWTNPNYQFTTGLSSQDVSYTLEIDSIGAGFDATRAKYKALTIASDLSTTLTQDALNDILLNKLKFTLSVTGMIEVRLIASFTNGDEPLYSNVLNFKVVPYPIPPKVTPPSSGKLFITGSATPLSWMAGGDPEALSQKFNQVTPTFYELPSITLTGGGSFLFVPVYGNWDHKYGFTGNGNENNVNGDDFRAEGNDLKGPLTTGNYKVEVDFQSGTYTVTHL